MGVVAHPTDAAAQEGYWANRLTLSLASGPTLPTWDEMKVMTGGRFTGSYGLEDAVDGRLAGELTAGAWVVLQNLDSGSWEGPTVIYVHPGLRGRLLDGPFTPFAALHVGLDINRAAYVDGGTNDVGFGFDTTIGVELVPVGWFDVELFVSYHVTTNCPIPRDGGENGAAGFFILGVGLGVSIPGGEGPQGAPSPGQGRAPIGPS